MASKGRSSDISNWYSGGAGYTVQGSRPAVAAPPPSQIPGLGHHADDAGTRDAGRPVVHDTDSSYVRLARQGGQRNLLSMERDDSEGSGANVGAARSNPAAQMKPEWFYDNTGYHNNTTSAGSQSQHTSAQYQGSALQAGEQYATPAHYDDAADMKRFDPYTDMSDYDHLMPAGYDVNDGYNEDLRYDEALRHLDHDRDLVRRQNDEDRHSFTRDAPPDVTRSRQVEQSDGRLGSAFSSVSRTDYGAYSRSSQANSNNSSSLLDNGTHQRVNRMTREQSAGSDMSKLLSFGYLDATPQSNVISRKSSAGTRYQPSSAGSQAARGNDLKMSEYHANRQAAAGTLSSSETSPSQRPAAAASSTVNSFAAGSASRRPQFDDRPDFFRLGSGHREATSSNTSMAMPTGPTADQDHGLVASRPPQFGRRKASAEMDRPSFFGAAAAYENSAGKSETRSQFARTRRDSEQKPDFFNIGSGADDRINSASAQQMTEAATDDLGILDKVCGSATRRDNYRRQKMDPNSGILPTYMRRKQ